MAQAGWKGMSVSEEQLEVYEEAQGQWRWRKVTDTGETVDESDRTYTRRRGARAAARRNDATLTIGVVRERPDDEGDYHLYVAKATRERGWS